MAAMEKTRSELIIKLRCMRFCRGMDSLANYVADCDDIGAVYDLNWLVDECNGLREALECERLPWWKKLFRRLSK